MSREVQTIYRCDFCGDVIKDQVAAVLEKDLCIGCLTKLHKEAEEQYMRLVKGQVRDRRGGWRQLGMIDS